MKYLKEFRDWETARAVIAQIQHVVTRSWALMEVCGGQTHSLMRYGIDQLLPKEIELIHGPGCPVCVTPVTVIDRALEIASRPNVIFCTFGDMLRVPGTAADLSHARSTGSDVRIVYSPLDALKLAIKHPECEVVFLAIGFETTAPANAMLVKAAKTQRLRNFSMLTSQVLVPPAMELLLSSDENRVDGFLAAGHVCSVMGFHQYHSLAERFKVPIVVTGFEPLDLLEGIRRLIVQLENGCSHVENAYQRVVTEEGNLVAQMTIDEVFTVTDQYWRGIGLIPNSGWTLREEYSEFDADKRFPAQRPIEPVAEASQRCRSGDVLRGIIKPNQCPEFGLRCTPLNPQGATMVSSEGACAAYFHNGRFGNFPESHD